MLSGSGDINLVCSRCGNPIATHMEGFPPYINAVAKCSKCDVSLHLNKASKYTVRTPMLADLEDDVPPALHFRTDNMFKTTPESHLIEDVADRLTKNFSDTQTERPRLFYHYTSVEALYSILSKGAIWASDIAFLNDSSELSYASDLITSVTNEFEKEASPEFLELLKRAGGSATEPTSAASGYLVCCFCVDGDLLSQWRAYGDGGKGIALGFDAHDFSVPELLVRRVLYNEQQQSELVRNTLREFRDLFKNICTRYTASEMDANKTLPALSSLLRSFMTEYSFTFKHPAFAEEKEWRIIVPYDRSEWLGRIRFRPSKSLLIPYTMMAFGDHVDKPHLPLLQLVHGPTLHPELLKKSLHLLLEQKGYEHVEVRGSSAPLRV
ncbi:DUF2971 domain-containing protein [Sphingorhabdus sp.]|jgi:hypothetical protein|uniref:DUF2971 domain-containing protein n=1 Tax=Sphingorhabdus sp. TaxID=1902408 RepID=UPI003783CE9F